MAESVLEDAEANAKLRGCLGGLAEHEQKALRGAFFDGNTYDELAARMSVPLGTMKSWIRRALMKLKASTRICSTWFGHCSTMRSPIPAR